MFSNLFENHTLEENRNLPWRVWKKRVPVYAWIKKRTSHSDWAEDRGDGILRKRNDTMIDIINGRTHPFSITNDMLSRHEFGYSTLYATAKPRAEEMLLCLDIDVQKSQKRGSPEGARRLVEWLKAKWFPNLYWETSRSGEGVNGYFVLRSQMKDMRMVRNHLKLLQTTLNAVAHEEGFDVEAVEVKGHPLEAFWSGGRCTSVTQGLLYRLPRHIYENADALMNTTVLSWDEMLDIIAYHPAPKAKPVQQSHEKRGVRDVRTSGSRVGFFYMVESDVHLIQPNGHLHSWGESIVRSFGQGKGTISISSRTVVTVEDVAACLLILRFCAKHPNADGSLPWARVQSCWNSLYEHGLIKRPFNDRRYAAIRRILDRMHWIKWERREYCPGFGAARWTLTKEAMELLDWEEMFVGTSFLSRGERANLSETGWLADLVMSDQKDLKLVIDPILAVPWDEIRLLERQMMTRIEEFCGQLAA
jgi:hypothetical protein